MRGMRLDTVRTDADIIDQIHAFTVGRNHVGGTSGMKGVVFCYGSLKMHLVDAFLCENAGEFGVRRKSDRGKLLGFAVAFHTGRTMFFICTDNKTYAEIRIRMVFFKAEHSHICGGYRSLVIDDAASAEILVIT